MAEKRASRSITVVTVILTLGLLWIATPGTAQETYEPWVTDFGREAPAPAYTPWVTDFGGGGEVTDPQPVLDADQEGAPTAAFDWSDVLLGALAATLVWAGIAMAAVLFRSRRRVAA
ncbi:MAG TPA: hypothetical protein VF097_10750 [Actinomycetota bacterium]